MVVLVALLQSSQYRDGRQLVGLVHHDRLESALQGLVLLEVFLVFVQRRGTDGTQLATRQGGLQDVGGIHGALAAAGTYQRVYLVDEEDDAPVGLRHLVDDGFQSLLKLTLVLRASHQGTHVQRVELLVFQVLGHVATPYALCQPLGNGRLARARLTYQYGVVFRAAREYLQHAAYLVVTSDDGVQLALTRQVHQVLGILLQALVVVVSRLRLHLLPLAKSLDGSPQVLLRTACILQDTAGR